MQKYALFALVCLVCSLLGSLLTVHLIFDSQRWQKVEAQAVGNWSIDPATHDVVFVLRDGRHFTAHIEPAKGRVVSPISN